MRIGSLALGVSALRVEEPPLRIGIISDEVDSDFESALGWIREQGLEWVELRDLWGKYVTDLSPAEVARAKLLLQQYGLKVSLVDSAYLKTTMPGTAPIPNEQMLKAFGNYPLAEHDRHLGRALDKARAFGIRRVRVFSYWRVPHPGRVFEAVKERLARAVSMAERAGVDLVLENEYSCNVATGAELAAMLGALPSPRLAGLWDPGNALAAGERPFPDGYRKLDKTRLGHIHLKDAVVRRVRDPAWVPIGKGQVDVRGQLRALVADRYTGVVSVETHYVPKGGKPADGSRETVEGLKGILKEL